jgi:large subunit ribosomal protein L3
MMNLWDEKAVRHPITVLCVDRCHVVQVKEPQANDIRDRWAVQVGAGPKRPYKTNKSLRYHFAKAGVEPKQKAVEFLVPKDAIIPVGTEMRASHFQPGQHVDVTGTSIGKGFQGPMKRWGFKGGNASHGNSKAHRSHGSTGMSTKPGRTFKGKKMAGRMGGDKVTVQNLLVYRVDEPRNLIYIRGAVPGNSGNWVRVRDAVKKPQPNFEFLLGSDKMISGGLRGEGVVEWTPNAAVKL